MKKWQNREGPRKLTDFFPAARASPGQDSASRSLAHSSSMTPRGRQGGDSPHKASGNGNKHSSNHSTPCFSPHKSKFKANYHASGCLFPGWEKERADKCEWSMLSCHNPCLPLSSEVCAPLPIPQTVKCSISCSVSLLTLFLLKVSFICLWQFSFFFCAPGLQPSVFYTAPRHLLKILARKIWLSLLPISSPSAALLTGTIYQLITVWTQFSYVVYSIACILRYAT